MGGDESGAECTTRSVLLSSKPKATQLGPFHFPRWMFTHARFEDESKSRVEVAFERICQIPRFKRSYQRHQAPLVYSLATAEGSDVPALKNRRFTDSPKRRKCQQGGGGGGAAAYMIFNSDARVHVPLEPKHHSSFTL